LVTGEFGQGRVVAYTGFTPALDSFSGTTMDNQLVYRPSTHAQMLSFAELLALASPGQQLQRESLAERETPLFETLQKLPATQLAAEKTGCEKADHGGLRRVRITNTAGYAHLVHLRMEWSTAAPYIEELSDNDFELLPNESREIELRWRSNNPQVEVHGAWVLDAANAAELRQAF
jgi:hypothetical protein